MDLGTYLKPLRQMWWLILAAVVIATVSSFLMVRRVPSTYQSYVVLMVGHALENPNPTSTDLYMSQQLAATYVDILGATHCGSQSRWRWASIGFLGSRHGSCRGHNSSN